MWGYNERWTDRKVERVLLVAGQELVRESQSFLAGVWAVERAKAGLPVPEWAWLSALAHAPADVMSDWAVDAPATATADRSTGWRRALSLLARELLNEADRRGCDIEDVQRASLVPLELDSWRPGAQPLRSPRSLVGAVHRSLGYDPDDGL